MAESPPDLEALDLDDLKRLCLQLLEEIAALRAENAFLRAEIARLKGLEGRPKIKPSGMDQKAAEPRRFVLALYHQGQSTLARLVASLRDIGVDISKRQVMRLLNEGQARFTDEVGAVLRAGLKSAAWVSVDDSGAHHRTRNGLTTQIGNDRIAWFATSFSKSRRTFLELLRAASVIFRDDAGQFNVGHRALCWVHAERLIHKLDCLTAAQAQAKERIRARLHA